MPDLTAAQQTQMYAWLQQLADAELNHVLPAVADIRPNADMIPGLVQLVEKLPTTSGAAVDVNALAAALKPLIDAAVKDALDRINVTSTVITTLTEGA